MLPEKPAKSGTHLRIHRIVHARRLEAYAVYEQKRYLHRP
jgi:hypothetical protein